MKAQPYVAGVGAVNVDVMGRSKRSLVAEDSNPGQIKISIGGATHNASENAARLGVPVNFITATGDDYFGQLIRAACENAGLSTEHFVTFAGQVSSTYMSVHDRDGEMNIAVSDMNVLQHLSPSHLEQKRELLANAAAITFDTGLPLETIDYILQTYRHKTVIFADPVSTTYAEKLVGRLSGIHTLKPNLLEAEVLSDVKIHSFDDLEKAASRIIDSGVKRVFISLGKNGVYYCDHLGTAKHRRVHALDQVANATGAGDAFLGGLLYAYMHNLNIDETLTTAMTVSKLAILSEQTINPQMSESLLKETILQNI